MDISVAYDNERSLCLVRVVGKITDRDDVRTFFGPARPILEEQGSTKVLFDIRDAEILADTIETFYAAADPQSWGWKREYAAAVVYAEITENARFLETVGLNRGIQIKVFEKLEEAKDWLSNR
jgi:hypothetical protein